MVLLLYIKFLKIIKLFIFIYLYLIVLFDWDENWGEERALLACGEGAVGDSVISTQLYPTLRALRTLNKI